MYEFKPIDTSDIILPGELLALTEKIAENVHDVWAVGRLAEEWAYDEVKDTGKSDTIACIICRSARKRKRL